MQRLNSSGLLASMFWWTTCGLLSSACGSSGQGPGDPPSSTANAGSGGGTALPSDAGAVAQALPRPERVDLVLMVDNSISMNEKHPLFADAVTGRLRRLRPCRELTRTSCGNAASLRKRSRKLPSAAPGVGAPQPSRA